MICSLFSEVRPSHHFFIRRCADPKDAVDAIIGAGLASTRVEAVEIGLQLENELQLFQHVCGDHNFCDDYLFYRFQTDTLHGKPANETSSKKINSRKHLNRVKLFRKKSNSLQVVMEDSTGVSESDQSNFYSDDGTQLECLTDCMTDIDETSEPSFLEGQEVEVDEQHNDNIPCGSSRSSTSRSLSISSHSLRSIPTSLASMHDIDLSRRSCDDSLATFNISCHSLRSMPSLASMHDTDLSRRSCDDSLATISISCHSLRSMPSLASMHDTDLSRRSCDDSLATISISCHSLRSMPSLASMHDTDLSRRSCDDSLATISISCHSLRSMPSLASMHDFDFSGRRSCDDSFTTFGSFESPTQSPWNSVSNLQREVPVISLPLANKLCILQDNCAGRELEILAPALDVTQLDKQKLRWETSSKKNVPFTMLKGKKQQYMNRPADQPPVMFERQTSEDRLVDSEKQDQPPVAFQRHLSGENLILTNRTMEVEAQDTPPIRFQRQLPAHYLPCSSSILETTSKDQIPNSKKQDLPPRVTPRLPEHSSELTSPVSKRVSARPTWEPKNADNPPSMILRLLSPQPSKSVRPTFSQKVEAKDAAPVMTRRQLSPSAKKQSYLDSLSVQQNREQHLSV